MTMTPELYASCPAKGQDLQDHARRQPHTLSTEPDLPLDTDFGDASGGPGAMSEQTPTVVVVEHEGDTARDTAQP